MTDKCHGLPITVKHDLVALGIEGVRGHCLLMMLLDTRLAGSGWCARKIWLVTLMTTTAIMFQAQRIHLVSNNMK
jgi:hypothetical protein